MDTKRRFPLFIFLCALAVLAAPSPSSAQDAVSDLLGRINGLRSSLGLPGYTLNGALSAAALNHAQWMVNTGQISHTQADGSTPSSRAAAAGYPGSWVSENIYMGSRAGVGDAWGFWLNSPIHYRGMTNPNYQEIGIASAAGASGQSFVLVFGSPGGSTYIAPRSSGSGGAAVASGPPPFVVGLDNFGNIMHEVQPDQTIGDILLTYGYTWDDLPYFLTLNAKSSDDIRRLQIGEIVLVPPYEGTYTPTPLPEGWPTPTPTSTATPLPDEAIATAIAEAAEYATLIAQTPSPQAAQPTVSPAPITDEATPVGRIATAAGVPVSLSLPTATPSPSPSPTPDPTLVASIRSTPAPLTDVIAPASAPAEIPWLWIAIGVQVGVALMAGAQFLRRRR
ncbi:MAG: CAP domain-containing protein [Anaerolineae bacterium]|jgi:hypothetical protein|nr:CAP domain-containing protein [Anaerolineae bacterium]